MFYVKMCAVSGGIIVGTVLLAALFVVMVY
jgi:hypothetical protein